MKKIVFKDERCFSSSSGTCLIKLNDRSRVLQASSYTRGAIRRRRETHTRFFRLFSAVPTCLILLSYRSRSSSAPRAPKTSGLTCEMKFWRRQSRLRCAPKRGRPSRSTLAEFRRAWMSSMSCARAPAQPHPRAEGTAQTHLGGVRQVLQDLRVLDLPALALAAVVLLAARAVAVAVLGRLHDQHARDLRPVKTTCRERTVPAADPRGRRLTVFPRAPGLARRSP